MIERGLVTTGWLAGELGRPGLRVVDGSMYLPTSGRDAAKEYARAHIPGALFFDLDASSDRGSALPHMLPSPEAFAARMGHLGIGDGDDVVVYDGSGGNLSAARVWWMFRVFGHPDVALLDGGIGKWRSEGRPLETGGTVLPPATFTARPVPADKVVALPAVHAAMVDGRTQIVDMRSAGRFTATEPEPRQGLRGGHIPGSLNLPYDTMVGGDGTVLTTDLLRRRLADAGVDPSRPLIATCGSGVSACTLLHALHLLGYDHAGLYDGAWTEWGGRDDTPVERGPA